MGGDVLAEGYEEDLWSPLADQFMLSAISTSSIESLIAVHAPSSDGELKLDYILERLSKIARLGGMISIGGLELKDVPLLEKLLNHCYTEASSIPLLALKGGAGTVLLRRGTREVGISPLMACTFYLDSKILFSLQPLARALETSGSFFEAVERAHSLGIYTEYDLERDIINFKPKDPVELLKLRERGRSELRSMLK